MEIKGKIVSILPLATGTSAKGAWKKQEYILQTTEQYPKKICFVVWGEKIDEYAIKENDAVEVSIDIESREFNGRWYTDVKAWKVVKESKTVSVSDETFPPPPPEPPLPEEMVEDLPF
jgi:hypothetical protein